MIMRLSPKKNFNHSQLSHYIFYPMLEGIIDMKKGRKKNVNKNKNRIAKIYQ